MGPLHPVWALSPSSARPGLRRGGCTSPRPWSRWARQPILRLLRGRSPELLCGGGGCPNLATLSGFMCCVPGAPVVCPAPSAAGGCVPRPLGRPPVRPAPPAHTPAPAPTARTARDLLVLRSDSCQCDLHGPRWQRKHGARTAARRGAEGTSCATCACAGPTAY